MGDCSVLVLPSPKFQLKTTVAVLSTVELLVKITSFPKQADAGTLKSATGYVKKETGKSEVSSEQPLKVILNL